MKSNVKLNFIYQAFYEVLIILAPLIVSPHVSRVLGAENVGVYSYTYSIAYYFVLFSALGIKNYGNREIAKVRDDREELNEVFSSLFMLHALAAIIVIIAYYGYVLIALQKGSQLYSALMGIYVISAFFDISWFFFGLEQFRITVTRNSIIKIVSIILIITFVRSKDDLWKYIMIFVITNLLSQIYLWKYLFRYVSLIKVPIDRIWHHLPQMLLLFVPTIAISLYNYMDKIMVGSISTKEQLGLYDNAEKIIFAASQFIGALGTVMMPKMSNIIAKHDKEQILRYIDISMQVVMCMAFAFAAGIIGISKVFAPFFWGKEFAGCSALLFALAFALPFKGFANVLRTQFLIPSRHDKAYTVSVCVGAAINLIANYVLIAKIHAMGAVVGTIVAEATVCIIQSYYCKKDLPIHVYIAESIPYLLICSVMAVIVYLIGYVNMIPLLKLIIQVFTGMIVYSSGCLVYIKCYHKQEMLSIVRTIMKKVPILKRFSSYI